MFDTKDFRNLLDSLPDYEDKRNFIDWMNIKNVHHLAATICWGINLKTQGEEATFQAAYEECSDDPRHWAQHFCRKGSEFLIKCMDRTEALADSD